jgi:riboflavin synthase
MFSGIIEDVGLVNSFNMNKTVISITTKFTKLKLGDSISCSGVCLTVSKILNKKVYFNLSTETLDKTNFSELKIGDKINLERSLRMGQEINGHMVFGHIDGLSKIKKIINLKGSWIFEIEPSKKIMKFLTPKCSIALNGVSLTVNAVKKKSFEIAIVPFTWENTSLRFSSVNDQLNTEIDMLARYVFKALKK